MNDFLKFLEETGVTLTQIQEAEKRGIPFIPNASENVAFHNSAIHGIGMFSKVSFIPGALISNALIDGAWTEAGRFANHSPTPNMIAIGSPNNMWFEALSEINAGNELTVNYRSVRSVLRKEGY